MAHHPTCLPLQGIPLRALFVTPRSAQGIALHRDYNTRLLPTDEFDSVKTTLGTATVQITGSEQQIGYSAGTITFGGSEQSSC